MLVPDAWFYSFYNMLYHAVSRMLGSGCFVPGAWSLVLDSRCSVPGARFLVLWFRLTEYKVICYEKFVFNSLKRWFLWVGFSSVRILFASFNFTKLQFIVVSSLMFFDSHSRPPCAQMHCLYCISFVQLSDV